MRYFHLAVAALVLTVLMSFAAIASTDKENMGMRYDVFHSGVKVGELKVFLKDDGKNYDYTALLDSTGMVRKFTDYWSVNRAQGKIENGEYMPKTYNSKWNRKKESQKMVVTYADDGVVENVELSAIKKPNPEFEDDLKDNTLDPVTTALSARSKIKAMVEGGQQLPVRVKLPVFDAKRRFDINLVVHGYKNIRVDGKERNLLHISFKREPVAGFRKNELKRMDQQEPRIQVYLDENFIPVWGYGKAKMGTATSKLAKFCPELDGCSL